jgi:hypothetical protein
MVGYSPSGAGCDRVKMAMLFFKFEFVKLGWIVKVALVSTAGNGSVVAKMFQSPTLTTNCCPVLGLRLKILNVRL